MPSKLVSGYARGLWLRTRRPSRLSSNDLEGSFVLGLIVLTVAAAFVAAGLLAIYFVKRYGRSWYRTGGITMLAAYLAGACAAMMAGSVVSWLFLRPRPSYGQEPAPVPWDYFLPSAGYFFAVTFVAIMGAILIETFVRKTWLARFSETIGVVTMAAIFTLWPVVKDINALIANPVGVMLNCVVQAAETFSHLVFQAFNNPFKALWGVVEMHGGNQFELAEYYPGVLVVLLIVGGVGALFQASDHH